MEPSDVLAPFELAAKAAGLENRAASGNPRAVRLLETLRDMHSAIRAVDGPDRVPVLTRLSDVSQKTLEWLWPDRIALGKLTMIVGDPGLGKSLLTLDLAARVSRGAALPATELGADIDDSESSSKTPGSVVLLSAEDDVADTILPRLVAAGADLSRVVALRAVARPHRMDPNHKQAGFDLKVDLPALKAAIAAAPDCRLVVIDPISAYLGKCDAHRNADVRRVLHPLAELAAEHHVAVVLVNHLNKCAAASTLHRAMGSLAFAATARSVLAVVDDSQDSNSRLCVSIKSNLGQKVPGIGFRIETDEAGDASAADTATTTPRAPRVVWGHASIFDQIDALAWQSDDIGTERSGVEEAMEWLAAALEKGPVPAKQIKRLAAEDGIAQRTLWRAKTRLRVRAYREVQESGHRYVWALPKMSPPSNTKPARPNVGPP